MALSGTVYGSFSGVATSNVRPAIEWSATQSITGNYSDVTATLVFYRYNTSWQSWSSYGHTVSFNINGNVSSKNCTFDIRGTSRDVIWTRTRRVYHNSDGSKSFTLGASGSTGVSLGSYNFSDTEYLNTIPRASSLDAFSFDASLQASTSVAMSVSIDRKSTSFDHDITLKHGSYTLKSWSGQGAPTKLYLSASEVNTLLNRMSSTTSTTLTLTIQTKSGSTSIGSSDSRNAIASVHSSVAPTASLPNIGVSGTGYDNQIGAYVQDVTRVDSSFTPTAGYGASIDTTYIVVRRSDGSDRQEISGTNGTTNNAVSGNGSYEAVAYVKDTRGRTATRTIPFNVTAYEPPTVDSFTAQRDVAVDTTIITGGEATFTSINGDNKLDVDLTMRPSGGTWSNYYTAQTGILTGAFSFSQNITGNSVVESFELKLYVQDSFGNHSEATTTVSTAKVVMDIHKNEGVGIGKLHELGALDVGGDMYIDGTIYGGSLYPEFTVTEEIDGTAYPLGITIADGDDLLTNPESYGTLVTFNHGAYRLGQLYFGHHGDSLYHRGFRDTEGWSTWKQLGAGTTSEPDLSNYLQLSGGDMSGPIGSTDNIVRIYGGENEDMTLRMGDRDDTYGFEFIYKGTGSGVYNSLELWADNSTGTHQRVFEAFQNGNINFDQTVDIGGAEVVARGSNSNGEYVRFYNGTQICWNRENKGTISTWGAWGYVYGNSGTLNNYPVAFSHTPTVVKNITSSSHTIIQSTTDPDPTTTNPGRYEATRATTATVYNLTVHYIAIGRWK